MILILEDDPEQAFLMRQIIGRMAGDRCLATASCAEAARRVLSGEVSLLVSDLRLGKDSGIDLFRHLRGCRRHHLPPMVVYTGLNAQDREFRDAGLYTDAVFEKGDTSLLKLGKVIKELCLKASLETTHADIGAARPAMAGG